MNDRGAAAVDKRNETFFWGQFVLLADDRFPRFTTGKSLYQKVTDNNGQLRKCDNSMKGSKGDRYEHNDYE